MFSLWPARQLSWCRNKPKSLQMVEKWCQARRLELKKDKLKPRLQLNMKMGFPSSFSRHVTRMVFEHCLFGISITIICQSGVVSDSGCFSPGPSARLASIWGQMVFSLVRQLSLLDQLKFKIKTQEDTKEYKTHNSKLAKFTSERIDTSRLVWS